MNRVLIANRGEIAVRIIKACRRMGIQTVLAISEADQWTMGAMMADQTVTIGPGPVQQSYLNQSAIIQAAKMMQCDAIHPGYGFLSENPEFAKKCESESITFIGPGSAAIGLLGDKASALKVAKEAGLPLLPHMSNITSVEDILDFAKQVGYPILLKAVAGGGGRGIRVVHDEHTVPSAYRIALAEAKGAFGDDRLYVEKYISDARHIEVQVVRDQFGNSAHIFERDCTSQRRNQKIIEEAPAITLSAEQRAQITSDAVRLADFVSYHSVGTVEFIYDNRESKHYFLEMNTRLQVEHPVTEMCSGIDIVELAINIARGRPLDLKQDEIALKGHSIECRITAEDTENNFFPSPGRIEEWSVPKIDCLRVDTHCYPGFTVSQFYDSLLAKFITWGETRTDAIDLMVHALRNTQVSGIKTNIGFVLSLLESKDFRENAINTMWVESRNKSRN